MRAALAILTLLTAPAQADTFCLKLNALFENATTIAPPQGAETTCTTSLATTGETSTHCAWPFDYRSAKATQTFTTLTEAVQTCLGPELRIRDDQSVNHPDFYDLRIITTPMGEIGISLKDKAALQKTYVFLRVTPLK